MKNIKFLTLLAIFFGSRCSLHAQSQEDAYKHRYLMSVFRSVDSAAGAFEDSLFKKGLLTADINTLSDNPFLPKFILRMAKGLFHFDMPRNKTALYGRENREIIIRKMSGFIEDKSRLHPQLFVGRFGEYRDSMLLIGALPPDSLAYVGWMMDNIAGYMASTVTNSKDTAVISRVKNVFLGKGDTMLYLSLKAFCTALGRPKVYRSLCYRPHYQPAVTLFRHGFGKSRIFLPYGPYGYEIQDLICESSHQKQFMNSPLRFFIEFRRSCKRTNKLYEECKEDTVHSMDKYFCCSRVLLYGKYSIHQRPLKSVSWQNIYDCNEYKFKYSLEYTAHQIVEPEITRLFFKQLVNPRNTIYVLSEK